NYLDWNNLIPILKKAYQMKINVLIIGPKGSGKTTLIQYLAEELGKELYTVNFSLRTKESNLIGTISLDGNSTKFNYGILPLSMKAGGILYLDEVNAAEPDVLIRLDEALDDRRQLVLKESEKVEVIQAHPDWWVVATINPLSHTGTKELPQQLLSRFPIRIWLDYPPVETIINIVQNNIGGIENQHLEIIKKAVFLMLRLYEAHKMDEIYYSPSLREVIAFAKLIRDGIDFKDALKIVFINCYYQWGSIAVNKVLQFTESIFGKIEGDEK
ncbi:MAG: MoxR family ATPase, partial [Candidatus Nanoarchaeia archaeon]|nr:MoxR family ATPase [Candidatus Jingweiarchaeum tengchongense]